MASHLDAFCPAVNCTNIVAFCITALEPCNADAGSLAKVCLVFLSHLFPLSDARPESCFPRMSLLQTCSEHRMPLKGCILRDPVLQAFAGQQMARRMAITRRLRSFQ